MATGEFGQEQARDQEARENEEGVDSEVATAGPPVPEVVRDDRGDGQRTKPVERRLVRDPPVCRPLHGPPRNTDLASAVGSAMTAIPVRRLNHAVLYVRDVERSVTFYREVLGLEPVHADWKAMGAAFFRAAGSPNDHDLGLFAIGANAPGPVRGAVGLYHLAWEVDSIEDLVAAREVLAARRGSRRAERPRRDEVALRTRS